MCSVLDSVFSDPHVFRGSRHTAASKKLMIERKRLVTIMIDECKSKAVVMKAKHREERRATRKRDPLLGQRVLIPGERWNIGRYCAGVIIRRGQFIPRGETKRIIGYCVKYVDDNKIEWWKIEDLEEYFVHGDITASSHPDLVDMKKHDRVYAAWQKGTYMLCY